MTIERHSRARQIELGRSIALRHKIYLDACFWIIMRDTALGIRAEPAARRLLDDLRQGVANGCLICPISASMFLELMKQPYDPGRRVGTSKLIDELSLGVSMIPLPIVMSTEIYSFLLQAKGGVDLYPMQELIWTKVAYVLGDNYPSLEHLPSSQNIAIQTSFFDHFWSLPLCDIVTIIGENNSIPDEFCDLSQYTNEMNARHRDELRSFTQTYEIELRGGIEIAADVAADVVHHLVEKESGRQLSPTPDERVVCVNMCRNLLYNAMKKPDAQGVLRNLYVSASIHAAMRWDKHRKFRPNDYYDFEHATAALSYCDAFLTEGPLRDLVTRPQLNLQSVNGCRVFSNVELAGDHIRTLSVPVKERTTVA